MRKTLLSLSILITFMVNSLPVYGGVLKDWDPTQNRISSDLFDRASERPFSLTQRFFLDNDDMRLSDWDDTGRMLLVEAIKGEQMENITWLVEQGACLDCYDVSGMSPLSQATDLARIELIEYLVSNGAKVDGVEHCVTKLSATEVNFLGNPLVQSLSCYSEPPIFKSIRRGDYNTYGVLIGLGSIWDFKHLHLDFKNTPIVNDNVSIYNFKEADIADIIQNMTKAVYVSALQDFIINQKSAQLQNTFEIHPSLVYSQLSVDKWMLNWLIRNRADYQKIELILEWGANPYLVDEYGYNSFETFQVYGSGDKRVLRALESYQTD